MNKFSFLLSILLIGFATVCLANDFPKVSELITEIYQPDHITPDQLNAIIAPLYSDNSFFSADNRQLIIRAKQPIMNEILSLLPQLDHPPRMFSVQFSHSVDKIKKTYSTSKRSAIAHSFSMSENSTLTVVREQQHQQLNALSPVWIRVENAPTEKEYLSLELRGTNNHAYITIKWHSLKNGHFRITSRQLNGPIGQWLSLGDSHKKNRHTISSRTHQRHSQLPFFIKIEAL